MPLAQAEVADNKGATEGFIYRACISEHEKKKSYLSSNFYTHICWILLSPDQKNTTFTTFLHSVRPHTYIQRYIGITAQDPTLAYISLHQDTTLSHYSQPFPPDNVIDPETHNVLKRCTRVGRAAWLLWKEIVLLFRACAPQ